MNTANTDTVQTTASTSTTIAATRHDETGGTRTFFRNMLHTIPTEGKNRCYIYLFDHPSMKLD
jgi:hypothetical protein